MTMELGALVVMVRMEHYLSSSNAWRIGRGPVNIAETVFILIQPTRDSCRGALDARIVSILYSFYYKTSLIIDYKS